MEAAENTDGKINGATLAIIIIIILVAMVVVLVFVLKLRTTKKKPDVGLM